MWFCRHSNSTRSFPALYASGFSILPPSLICDVTTSRYSEHPVSASRAIAERVISAAFTADFTSDPRRQTDRRIRGRTSADAPDQPAPSRICRTYTAGHRPAWVCRIRRRTFLIHRAAAARPAVCLYFWLFVPHSGQNFPVAVAPHCGHFQLPAAGFGSGFCCRSSGRNCR